MVSSYLDLQLASGQSIGVDIVSIDRIKTLYQNHGPRFINKILTKQEQLQIASYTEPTKIVNYLAKRWSAKEAFSKALGCGIGHRFSFQDLSVISKSNSKPLAQTSKKVVKDFDLKSYDITWSDEKEFVVAFCLIEKEFILKN